MQSAVILFPATDSTAGQRGDRLAERLAERLADATGSRPDVRAIRSEGAVAAEDLAAAQGALLVVVMGRSAQIDVLADLARLRGAVVDAVDGDLPKLFGALEERLGRAGLAGWLAAADAGPVALVDWARANPADPLARSAALGMTPAEHRAMVVGPGAPPEWGATPDLAAQQPVEQPAKADPGPPDGDGPGAPPTAGKGGRLDRFAGPMLVAALSAALFLVALWLLDLDKAVDRQFMSAVGLLAAVTSGLVASRWPIPMQHAGRAAFVLRYMVIAGGLLALALGFLLFFNNPDDLLSWFGLAFAAAIAGAAILFSLLVGATGMAIGSAARRAGRLDTLAFGSLSVVVAAVAIGAWQSFLFMSDPEKITELDAQLARTGNDDCSQDETDRTLAARVRIAEQVLAREATGRWSSDLVEALEALPPRTEFVLAEDGSGDARTLSEIVRRMCRLSGNIVVEVRPGTYRVSVEDRFKLDDVPAAASPITRRLILKGVGTGRRPEFRITGGSNMWFTTSSWASVAMSDLAFVDDLASGEQDQGNAASSLLILKTPTTLERVTTRAAMTGGVIYIEADSVDPGGEPGKRNASADVSLANVEVSNSIGPALEIAGKTAADDAVAAAAGEPLGERLTTVSIGGSGLTSGAHNPVTMNGLAKLDIRDTRISSGNRDNYCISLADKASYTASGLTMQCAGSPRGMTAAEQDNPQ